MSPSNVQKGSNLSSGYWLASDQHLITQILSRLPVKSVIRFKCVSKPWLSLITCPYFPPQHSLHNPQPKPLGVFFNTTSISNNPHFISYHNNTNLPLTHLRSALAPFKILQSCNGLMLCSSSSSSSSCHNYYICNPSSTKQFKLIPHPGLHEKKVLVGVSIAYDPFDLPSYRLVCVWLLKPTRHIDYDVEGHDEDDSNDFVDHVDKTYQVEIYSPCSGRWIPSGDPFTCDPYATIDFEHGVYWNGAIHWLLSTSVDRFSLHFDIENECINKMKKPPLPEGFEEHPLLCLHAQRFGYFGECSGRLYCILEMPSFTRQLDVLEMEKDFSGWVFKYAIRFVEVGSQFPEILPSIVDGHYGGYDYKVLTVVPGEQQDEEDFGVVLSIPGKIISYNPKTNSCVLLHNHMPLSVHETMENEWYNNYQYTETLCSVI